MRKSRFLHEKSVAYQGYLIIPFLFSKVSGQCIYSHVLLSELDYKDKLHKATNPAQLYSSSLGITIDIAKKYLDEFATITEQSSYFQCRYTYQHNLIVVHQHQGKVFYDHYPSHELRNIAAPKIFLTTQDCLNWIKQGLDQHKV